MSDHPEPRSAAGNPHAEPASRRLTYRRLDGRNVDAFHRLVTDPHIRRFLMDGQVMPREWSDEVVRTSDTLFRSRGVGIWLVFEAAREAPIGFCGYRIFNELGPEPQLLYALLESCTGRGYATEISLALVDCVRRGGGFGVITAAVDEPNAASVRVLEKAGFERAGEVPGSFGTTLLFKLPLPR